MLQRRKLSEVGSAGNPFQKVSSAMAEVRMDSA